jgi:hypothetical protein
LTATTLGRIGRRAGEKEVEPVFKELTDELLELTATAQGYRKAFLAQRHGPLCCTTSCCCAAYM